MQKLSLALLPLVLTLMAAPAPSFAAEPEANTVSVETVVTTSDLQADAVQSKKCLKNGKPCTKGKNCKPENCKKEEPEEEEDGGDEGLEE